MGIHHSDYIIWKRSGISPLHSHWYNLHAMLRRRSVPCFNQGLCQKQENVTEKIKYKYLDWSQQILPAKANWDRSYNCSIRKRKPEITKTVNMLQETMELKITFIISYADCILNIDQSVEVSKTYTTVFWVDSLGSDDQSHNKLFCCLIQKTKT